MILGAYASLAVGIFVLWLIDLWAKSYDIPHAQRWASVALPVAAAALSVLVVGALGFGITGVEGRVEEWLAWAAAVPVVAGLVALIYDLNWRAVYVASGVCLLGAVLVWEPWRRGYLLGLALSVAAMILAAGVASEIPAIRFARYERQLWRGCWCCGYKQRAVHELARFGRGGESVVLRYLAERPTESGSAETELQRARLRLTGE